MTVETQIAQAFAAIQAEDTEERNLQRRRELLALLKEIPSGSPDTPEISALWAEYDALVNE